VLVLAGGVDLQWPPQALAEFAGLFPAARFVLAAQSLQSISGQQRSLTWSIATLWLAVVVISFLMARLLPARTH